MSRAWIVLAAVAAGAVVAAAGMWESARDEDGRARELSAAWTAHGGVLVTPDLVETSSYPGLTCFRYGTATGDGERAVFCFDGDRRLVEVQHQRADRASSTSLLPIADRAPLRLEAAPFAAAVAIAGRVETLAQVVAAVPVAFAACRRAIESVREAPRTNRARLAVAFGSVRGRCADARSQLATLRADAEAFPAVDRLIGVLDSTAADAIATGEGVVDGRPAYAVGAGRLHGLGEQAAAALGSLTAEEAAIRRRLLGA